MIQNRISKMFSSLTLCLVFLLGVHCDPEDVSDNFGYDNYKPDDDLLRSLDLLMPRFETVYRPRPVKNWPQQWLNVGQITAVSINSRGQPVIFHRAERIWDETTFNESYVYQHLDKGPIAEETIIVLDPNTGSIVDSWGGGKFYVPHGLTVDRHDNVWLTDVAMHQVFKFVPHHQIPSLTIGEAFRSGKTYNSKIYLCMPTSVAVATTGEVFIADGYCNNQILKLNAAGELLRVIPTFADDIPLNVPHSLALIEHLDIICIADRENMRIICPKAGLESSLGILEPAEIIQDPRLGKVYAIGNHGNTLFAVNGPTDDVAVRGFTINVLTGNVIDTWEPITGFNKPHALAVTKNGSYIYVTEIGPNIIWKFELVEELIRKRK